jgi:hypothetical protein
VRILNLFTSLLFAACLLPGIGSSASATDDLILRGDQSWVVLASREDPDRAIAIARNNRNVGARTLVARSQNGWFAALSGPHTVRKGAGRQFLNALARDQGIPTDAFLSRGSGLSDVVWTPPATNVIDTLEYDGEHNVSKRWRDLHIRLSKKPLGADGAVATAMGDLDGRPAFALAMTENPSDKPASKVTLVRLDPNSPLPQVVFTYFWQGAHCCTVTKIASRGEAQAWHVIEGEALDGGGGYVFEDIEEAGFSYLLSNDQSFYYTFDSYAGSSAPIRIHQLVGNKLVDVTNEPKLRHRLLQALYALEEGASEDSWHSNGFLAGWVAASILVDRGKEAWAKMLANYDHQSDFGPQKCTTNGPLERCSESKKVRLAFPWALRQFLHDQNYIGDINSWSVPYEVEPVPK